ncbi:nucleotide-binding domain-containing protein [Dichomitus squalens LYAD-421 SS1]|uniref:Nucleotide-binding domain-containing protein n=1 Tax=Dichomitus squalens (strain LYAD-421) TaxID=732165 RepID=R7T1X2_DICSQ|nr:nucleotide-binding domain-containing protein [Dichomitus squalens LYAD-421 SS1]EJF62376.1 nucleotide-binding domain-containing protein [Dichomitus squalens LYAD-421 SS1]
MPTTVILGAGIIGLSSAHFLARIAPPDHRIHLVDPAPELFSSASGKAAGFLAKDWFAPAVASLGALSFDLHRALAEEHNGRARWGYSESVSYSLDHTYHSDDSHADAPTPAPASVPASSDLGATPLGQGGLDWLLCGASRATAATDGPDAVEKAPSESAPASTSRDLPQWLLANPGALEVLSDRTSTAQVVPRRLCEFLLEQCLAAGVTLHHPARATTLVEDESDPGGARWLRIEYTVPPQSAARAGTVDIPCENIVIAAGCWTPRVYATLFPNASRMPRIAHLAGYSATLRTKHWPPPAVPDGAERAPGPCHAVFTDAAGFAPEIFSRANGDVWLGGLNPPHTALPALPTDAHADPAEVARLLAVGRALCGDDVEVQGHALCFRPVSATGRPIIARMHEADLGDGLKPHGHGRSKDGRGGVFVATGHGPWGIALSLGTGRVVAEMVLGRETSADVEQLSRW